VAVANVMNLILVRADGRQRELAVREALGAGRGRILAHFLAESAVVTGLAAAVALVLAWAAIRLLVSMGPTQIPRLAEVGLDAATIAFTLGVAVLVAAVCALVPALRIGRQQLSQSIREGGRGSVGQAQQRVRAALVVAQIAVALVVLAGSGLLLRTFQSLNEVKPGWSPDGVSTYWVSLGRTKYKSDAEIVLLYPTLEPKLAQLRGVTEAVFSPRLPLPPDGRNQHPVYPRGDAPYANKPPPLSLYATVSGGYFRTL